MKNKPKLHIGGASTDERGTIFHNNGFDFYGISRAYIIENTGIELKRGWKGHLIEKRWFFCTKGCMQIDVIKINDLKNNITNVTTYTLQEDRLDVLEVPPGYATLIQQTEEKSRVVAFSDYKLGETDDDNLRWNHNHLEI